MTMGQCQALIALYEATPDKIPSGTGINGHMQSIRRSAGISLDRQNGGKLFETVFHALKQSFSDYGTMTAGGISNLTVNTVQGFDINGDAVPGISAVIVP